LRFPTFRLVICAHWAHSAPVLLAISDVPPRYLRPLGALGSSPPCDSPRSASLIAPTGRARLRCPSPLTPPFTARACGRLDPWLDSSRTAFIRLFHFDESAHPGLSAKRLIQPRDPRVTTLGRLQGGRSPEVLGAPEPSAACVGFSEAERGNCKGATFGCDYCCSRAESKLPPAPLAGAGGWNPPSVPLRASGVRPRPCRSRHISIAPQCDKKEPAQPHRFR